MERNVGCKTLIAEGAEAIQPDVVDWDKLAGRIARMEVESSALSAKE